MGEFKQLYVCKDCEQWFSGNPEQTLKGCPHCKGKLVYVPVNYEKYKAMDDEEKAAFKQSFLEKNDLSNIGIDNKVQLAEEQYISNSDIKDSNGWISGLRFVGWLIFILFFIGGIMLFGLLGGSSAGVFAFLLCVVGGFMSVAMTMVFLGMAKDLKAIRARLEKK